ncbi:MAG TPA: polysaccharide lyase family protein [Pirellulales bacterium]|nr:polysaccharide lyase family protein [Pirellulales bacterium]
MQDCFLRLRNFLTRCVGQFFLRRSLYGAIAWIWIAVFAVSPCHATITISGTSGSTWTISNGDLTVNFSTSASKLTSVAIGSSGNILDPNNSQLYDELAKSGLGSGTMAASYQQTSNYIDFYTTTQSNSSNPFTYQVHYVMFNNDPDIVTYEVVNHSATDIAGTYGQGQFLARVNTSMFNHTYQVNTGPNNIGVQTSTQNPYYAADGSPNYNTVMGQAGRNVQDATTDLTGSGLTGDWGTNIYTKYDYSSYTQFLQATTEYGSQYAVSALFTSEDTMTGGPTKQELMFTNNISMVEFLSNHYGTGDPNYGYTPAQGVNTSRLYGPYAFRFTPVNGESGAQLYQDAVNSMPALVADYNTDTELLTPSSSGGGGYIPTTQRGKLQVSVANTAGWSSNVNNNTIVLSDPNKSFQESGSGDQYWAQLSSSGTATISNIVPGTYRLSLYQLGQWGETRYDGIQVAGDQIAFPSNLKFTPENFGTAAPIWTIGTPNRSANEFLNGHATSANPGVVSGGDLRQYQGAYDFWAEEQTLGNPGKVVYFATAVGSTPATNDPNKWIANQWETFDPGLYDASNGTTDNYANTAPAYVRDSAHGGTGVGPANYHGSPWEVHFTTTTAQQAQGQYVVLSVGLASVEASLTVALNGHSETWHYTGINGNTLAVSADAMTRSGDAGVYQFLAFQFPTADLNAAGADNEFTFSVSTTDGDMYDALRMEITNTAADPSVTGWHDYEYITGANAQTDANNTVGLSTTEVTIVPGDFNRDGSVDAADIPAMLSALANLASYENTNHLTDAEMLALGDLNGSGSITNADLQTLINLLKSGGGSIDSVPEPPAEVLLAIGAGALLLIYTARQRRRISA